MDNLIETVSHMLELSGIHVKVLSHEHFFITSGYDGEFSDFEQPEVNLLDHEYTSSGSNYTSMDFTFEIKPVNLFQKTKRNKLVDTIIKDAMEQLDNIPVKYYIHESDSSFSKEYISAETVYPRGLLIYSSISDFNSCDREELIKVIYNNIMRYLKFIHLVNASLKKYSLKK